MFKKCVCGIAALFFVLITINISAQDLASRLDDSIAEVRINSFDSFKRTEIKRFGAVVDITPLRVSSIDMKSQLKQLIDLNAAASGRKYDGIRVYFLFHPALPRQPQRNLKFTLAFVPTFSTERTDVYNDIISKDDTAKAFILENNRFIKNYFDLKNVFQRYQSIILPGINAFIRKKYQTPNFEEAKSIWYSKAVLFDSISSQASDLYRYLTDHTEYDSIYIHYANWTHEKNAAYFKFIRKMDLVFELRSHDSSTAKAFFTLGKPEILQYLETHEFTDSQKEFLAKLYGNTGLPCPPNKCDQ